jgi:hypothetical protein
VPDPQLAAFFVVQTVEALSDAIAENPPAADQERVTEEMTCLIVNYLSKPATTATMPMSRALFSLPADGRTAPDAPWADLEP